VTIVAFSPESGGEFNQNHTQLPEFDLHKVNTDPFRYVELPSIVKYVSPIPLAYWPSRNMQQALGRLRRQEGWDVVVAMVFPVAQYALLWPTPRVLDVDTGLTYQMRQKAHDETRWVRRLRAGVSWQKARWYEVALVRRFQAASVSADHEVEHLRSMVGRSRCRVAVVPNGVDTVRNQPGLVTSRPRSLVYNGALSYSANYDAMVYFLSEIYPLIKQEIPDVTMAITGSTKNVDLSGLKLDDSVTLTGYVDDIRVPVAEATVCVVPLRQGSGTRLKILEAMALGTPVVTTLKGAEGLHAMNDVHCIIAESPEAFAAQTVSLLQRADLRQHLAASARRLVESQYDWQEIGRQFVELVEEAVTLS
jgi:glycosyltransferase involved in cell wall biosynthesis